MNYNNRSITDVQVSGLQRHEGFDGATVSGLVRLQLSAQDGNEFGPRATIELAADLSERSTLPEIERQLLTAALGVLTRLASLSPDEVHDAMQKSQLREYLPKTP
ncbi:hypothetical protein ATN84_16780 [Paramesorhizobium deserti]|uniref:Uncharacterized protein n=1 Tax=Paramesorhizobium deserti TaxID=1494590 RepID=A0A135HR17_9HYPH|nr:hypothetical protein [Paramesorhizobium deserti]KXF75645.1 hypothetical protein ATN84_16780 [Paramesorhizobium deserti]